MRIFYRQDIVPFCMQGLIDIYDDMPHILHAQLWIPGGEKSIFTVVNK